MVPGAYVRSSYYRIATSLIRTGKNAPVSKFKRIWPTVKWAKVCLQRHSRGCPGGKHRTDRAGRNFRLGSFAPEPSRGAGRLGPQASVDVAIVDRCAHGVDRNSRYEASEEEPGDYGLRVRARA